MIDIREQFPMLDPDDPHDITRIVDLAEGVGIRYPRDPSSKYPRVQTSDFVVTTKSGTHVYSIKESKEYDKERTRELQELERRYWAWRNIPWTIKTEQEINYVLASNIQWVYHARDIRCFFPDLTLCADVMAYEKELYEQTTYSINHIARDAEDYFRLRGGLGLTSFQRLLLEKKLTIPLNMPLDLMAPRLHYGKGGGWHSCLETYQ